MKRKRFYKNKKRNSKWTEKPQGRKIPFADKYMRESAGSDKFDNRRPKAKKQIFSKENALFVLKKLLVFICCLMIVFTGYTIMDVHMDRRSMPYQDEADENQAGISSVSFEMKSSAVESLSLDGAVMLDTVINEIFEDGYSSVSFDLKREDGTIGYNSSLATVDTYGAVSSPSPELEKSVSELLENDILPVGIVSCYKDNIAPLADISSAVFRDGAVYTDSEGASYLNPESASAYNYIKSIIEEAQGMGISVFVLDFCSLPEELGTDNGGGFEKISQKLYHDLGTHLKLLEAQRVTLVSSDSATLEEEAEEKIKQDITDDKIYLITAKEKSKVKKLLDNKKISSYILEE